MERIQEISRQIIQNKLNEDDHINDNSKLLLYFKKQMSLIKHTKSMMIVNLENTERFVETEQIRLSDYAAQTLNTSEIYLYKQSLLEQKKDNARSPKQGWFYLKMPFSTDESLQFRFSNIDGTTMRTGKILELMDYCAGIVSFRHTYSPETGLTPTNIVTGCLDNVRFFQNNIPINEDLYAQGYPTWVGSTSLEVRVDLFGKKQNPKNQKDQWDLYVSAFFLMVAKGKVSQSNYQLPQLDFDKDEDFEKFQLRWEMGKAHQAERLKQKNNNLIKNPPTAEESLLLHKIWQLTKQSPKSFTRIKHTQTSKQIVMHHQDKNIYMKVFGGVVLREAYDSAFSAIYLFSGEEPELFHIDDVSFLTGVDIGSLVNYHAYITYTEKHLAHVKVVITKIEPCDEQNKIYKTSEVHITMFSKKELKQVYPKSYEEQIDYLEGKRRITHISNTI
ncbi:acyl-CoA thioester hydrolase (macronuclear) [Tetrahymena thermophila SB210]|uniref:Acyl-CoA thioester hydrolase n=1 Tax=Tetrahymena thermophila (strain SB210) TaxID=312017 RepID=I7MDK6_TETTS|nr:acyl-CoA thioester hydrolase [Tetrahymena thermophila SB210]EAR89305.1 acyl-CoA thioester hydrolase [Tetrahymena thermophila SB210]|eukprot:XP_001009550.1 acyl-CoA thioester hydrolase [Tetrahymena thermophila SB210]